MTKGLKFFSGSVSFAEVFKIFLADTVNTAEFDTFKFAVSDKFENGQVMDLESLGDLFGRVEVLGHVRTL